MKTKVISILFAVTLLIGLVLTLTSCGLGESVSVIDARINGDGELLLTYSDGAVENLGTVVGNDAED